MDPDIHKIIEITVTESVVYGMEIDTADFPDNYNFTTDPEELLDKWVADEISIGRGYGIIDLTRTISVD